MRLMDQMISKVYAIRSYRYHYKYLKNKLHKLKLCNQLRTNPRKQLISSYPLLFHRNDSLWADYVYSLNGIDSESYIPLRAYYLIIEPTLNNRLMVSTLKDKNFYELFFSGVRYPNVLLRRINGFLYDDKYNRIGRFSEVRWPETLPHEVILKASLDSGSGQSIYLFKQENGGYSSGSVVLNDSFLTVFKHDFVLQERVEQHQYFAKFNTTSNNTIRVLTYRSVEDDSLNILHVLLRIGAKGSFLDHDNHGGVAISVDEDARLGSIAYDAQGVAHTQFNEVVFSEQGKVPFYQEIVRAALTVSSKAFYGRLLALDFTVSSSSEVLLLDVNCWRNGISQYQLSNGTMFGRYTQEVLEYCSKHASFNLLRVPIRG